MYSAETATSCIEGLDTAKVDKEMEATLQEIQLLLDNAQVKK